MDELEVVRRRLAVQRLAGPERFGSVAECVRFFGAVQAQEWAEVKWSIAQRTRGVDDAAVEDALARGDVVRTHALRPTWHLVAREDLGLVMAATAERVHAANRGRYRGCGLDDAVFARAHEVLREELAGGEPRTRPELVAALAARGIDMTRDDAAAHLLMHAELDLVLHSGPRRGKQHTYVAARDVPPPPADPQAELVRRYFAAHGPATVQDASWWSGLTIGQVRAAIARLGLSGDGWYGGEAEPASSGALLLGTYDEAVVAYRGLRGVPAFVRAVLVDGRMAGTWRRTLRPRAVTVEVALTREAGRAERAALEAEVERFGAFAGLPAALEITRA